MSTKTYQDLAADIFGEKVSPPKRVQRAHKLSKAKKIVTKAKKTLAKSSASKAKAAKLRAEKIKKLGKVAAKSHKKVAPKRVVKKPKASPKHKLSKAKKIVKKAKSTLAKSPASKAKAARTRAAKIKKLGTVSLKAVAKKIPVAKEKVGKRVATPKGKGYAKAMKRKAEQVFDSKSLPIKYLAKIATGRADWRVSKSAMPAFRKLLKTGISLILQKCVEAVIAARSGKALAEKKIVKPTLNTEILNAATKAASMENYFLNNAIEHGVKSKESRRTMLKNIMSTPVCALVNKGIKGQKTYRRKSLNITAVGLDHETSQGLAMFSTCFVFPRATFARLVKKKLDEIKAAIPGTEHVRMTRHFLAQLQYNKEVEALRFMGAAALVADARGAKTVQKRDVEVAAQAAKATPAFGVNHTEFAKRIRLESAIAPKTKKLAKLAVQESKALKQEPKKPRGPSSRHIPSHKIKTGKNKGTIVPAKTVEITYKKKPATPLIKGVLGAKRLKVENVKKPPKKITNKILSEHQRKVAHQIFKEEQKNWPKKRAGSPKKAKPVRKHKKSPKEKKPASKRKSTKKA